MWSWPSWHTRLICSLPGTVKFAGRPVGLTSIGHAGPCKQPAIGLPRACAAGGVAGMACGCSAPSRAQCGARSVHTRSQPDAPAIGTPPRAIQRMPEHLLQRVTSCRDRSRPSPRRGSRHCTTAYSDCARHSTTTFRLRPLAGQRRWRGALATREKRAYSARRRCWAAVASSCRYGRPNDAGISLGPPITAGGLPLFDRKEV